MMDMRRVACMTAAGFFSVLLVTTAASPAFGQSRVLVEAQRVDPSLQRKVSYRDLNLARSGDQLKLHGRISRTARSICADVNGFEEKVCPAYAIRSTRGQVAEAIERAKLRMAGKAAGPDVAITMAISGR